MVQLLLLSNYNSFEKQKSLVLCDLKKLQYYDNTIYRYYRRLLIIINMLRVCQSFIRDLKLIGISDN